MNGGTGADTAVTIRAVRVGDGAGCAEVWLDAARYYADLDPQNYQVPVKEGLVAWFEQINAEQQVGHLRLVASRGDELLGLVWATLRPAADDAGRSMVRTRGFPQVYVAALAVRAGHRRTGVGTALMGEVERWGRTHGAALVSLDTNLHSTMSVPVYEDRLGYQRHAVILQKWLP
ncbi:MAG TPA: GNAT family N-acetyltransferase [Micromonosporaceae bacterium]|nr:GNAT family N-acetyltransferase [Micromonosporaceae bacterium]